MALFWAARNATKNGTVLGRPGIRFAAPKTIPENFAENSTQKKGVIAQP
jgi:hypothetical protein